MGTGGLGLAIVHSVAQLHGGEAWCESDAAVNVFWLSLPADDDDRVDSCPVRR